MTLRPNLLIDNNCELATIPQSVLRTPYLASGEGFTSCKNRGTKIGKSDTGLDICAWQKLQIRFQKMDQYQPMIIRLRLNRKATIEEIKLDQNSIGSQGLTCSIPYLNRNLQTKLLGVRLVKENTDRFLTANLHCFHLQELLLGALTFLEHLRRKDMDELDEVEAAEFIKNGNAHIAKSYQRFSDGNSLEWSLGYENALPKIVYNRDGYIEKFNDVKVAFRFADEIVFEERLNGNDRKQCTILLTKLAFRIWHFLTEKIFPDKSIEFCHSSSYPFTLMGLIILGFAIEKYPENYNLVQHVVRACQRKDTEPLCVGAVNNINEARKCFVDLKPDDFF